MATSDLRRQILQRYHKSVTFVLSCNWTADKILYLPILVESVRGLLGSQSGVRVKEFSLTGSVTHKNRAAIYSVVYLIAISSFAIVLSCVLTIVVQYLGCGVGDKR